MRYSKWFKYLALPVAFGIFFTVANRVIADETDKINVFCVMSENIEAEVKVATVDLKVTENIETFALKGYQPHCTLYMTAYPKGRQKLVATIVRRIANTTKQFPINTKGIEVAASDWLFMGIENNKELQSLCDEVATRLAFLRAKSDYVPAWAKSMPAKVECIKKYGSPNVFSQFDPHLTLLAKSDGEMLKRFKTYCEDKIYNKPVSGKVVAIGYGLADRDGQIKTPIEVFPLAK